jgi:hypothetical protein
MLKEHVFSTGQSNPLVLVVAPKSLITKRVNTLEQWWRRLTLLGLKISATNCVTTVVLGVEKPVVTLFQGAVREFLITSAIKKACFPS